MGKGAGGCDDRRAFAIGEIAVAGEVADEESSAIDTAYKSIIAHREQYPGNNMLALGAPDPDGQSDRVRFRRMVKQLTARGEIVQTWEHSPSDDPTVIFDPQCNPVWTTLGAFQEYRQLLITVVGTPDEQAERLNIVQAAMQEHGFYGVITLEGKLQPIAKVLSYKNTTIGEMEILQAECVGYNHLPPSFTPVDLTDEDNLRRAVTILMHPGLQHIGVDQRTDWVPTEYSLDEITQWVDAGIFTGTVADGWLQQGFTREEAIAWVDEGWSWASYDSADLCRQAGATPWQGMFLPKVNLTLANYTIFSPQTWERIQAAYEGYAASSPTTHRLRHNIRSLINEYLDDPDSDEFIRDLQWLEAGFDIYPYSSGKQDPWNRWPGCTPQEAQSYVRAKFNKVPSGGSADAAVVHQWRSQCGDLALSGEDIIDLHKSGITASAFQQTRSIMLYEWEIGTAIKAGWDIKRLTEWKDVLGKYSFDRVSQFYELGAQLAEAESLLNARVSPAHYASIKAAFTPVT